MTDIKEVLLLIWAQRPGESGRWRRQVGVDPKTARSYVAVAESVGLVPRRRARRRSP